MATTDFRAGSTAAGRGAGEDDDDDDFNPHGLIKNKPGKAHYRERKDTIDPAWTQLEVTKDYLKGKLTNNLIHIIDHKQPRQRIEWRNGKAPAFVELGETRSKNTLSGIITAIYGKVNPVQCGKCREKYGHHVKCSSLTDGGQETIANGACGNCQEHGQGTTCEHHEDKGVLAPLTRQYKPKTAKEERNRSKVVAEMQALGYRANTHVSSETLPDTPTSDRFGRSSGSIGQVIAGRSYAQSAVDGIAIDPTLSREEQLSAAQQLVSLMSRGQGYQQDDRPPQPQFHHRRESESKPRSRSPVRQRQPAQSSNPFQNIGSGRTIPGVVNPSTPTRDAKSVRTGTSTAQSSVPSQGLGSDRAGPSNTQSSTLPLRPSSGTYQQPRAESASSDTTSGDGGLLGRPLPRRQTRSSGTTVPSGQNPSGTGAAGQQSGRGQGQGQGRGQGRGQRGAQRGGKK